MARVHGGQLQLTRPRHRHRDLPRRDRGRPWAAHAGRGRGAGDGGARRMTAMATHDRPARVAHEFQRELSALLARGLKDPRITGFITVTGAKMSPDLREVTAYVSVHADEAERERTLEGLTRGGRLPAARGGAPAQAPQHAPPALRLRRERRRGRQDRAPAARGEGAGEGRVTRRGGAGPDGVLVLDKPAGPTSFDAVARVKRAPRRAPRPGTPARSIRRRPASWPSAWGEAVKLQPGWPRATRPTRPRWPSAPPPTTQDAEGEVTERGDPAGLDAGALRRRAGRASWASSTSCRPCTRPCGWEGGDSTRRRGPARWWSALRAG